MLRAFTARSAAAGTPHEADQGDGCRRCARRDVGARPGAGSVGSSMKWTCARTWPPFLRVAAGSRVCGRRAGCEPPLDIRTLRRPAAVRDLRAMDRPSSSRTAVGGGARRRLGHMKNLIRRRCGPRTGAGSDASERRRRLSADGLSGFADPWERDGSRSIPGQPRCGRWRRLPPRDGTADPSARDRARRNAGRLHTDGST